MNSSDGSGGEDCCRAGAVVRRGGGCKGKEACHSPGVPGDHGADCYLMVDGDDTYPAEDAPAMVHLP